MKKNIKINILLVILVFIFLFSIIKITLFYVDENSNKNIHDELIMNSVDIKKITDGDEKIDKVSVDFKSLLDINKDIVGWIRFNDDKISYPIVKSTDNSYYLNRAFNKKKNSLGSIFMDYRNNTMRDKNIVIFGHNSTNGSMFGSLKDVLKDNFFENEKNKTIEIIDLNNNVYHYEIFSVYVTVKEEYYITTDFETNNDFLEFLRNASRRSIIKFNTNLSESDRILTLSTCNGVAGTNKRLAIHARLIY
ncbi:MAG: class B sortase [Erysipelotrichales bacterium]|nr:class B sortase [Erysipelotrichales bacterium]